MPDNRFFKVTSRKTITEMLGLAGAKLVLGDPNTTLTGVASHSKSDSYCVVYCDNARHIEKVNPASFGLCLTTQRLADRITASGAIAVSDFPKADFAICADAFYTEVIDTEQRLSFSDDVHIGANAYISASAMISENVTVGANSYIGAGVVLGAGCVIEDGVSIKHAIIEDEARISSGARIGQAGFGFTQGRNGLVRVPQLGRVIIKERAEIGANTTIDRGALDDTEIGAGTKIDNLVQIGHNVIIGQNCIIAAQTGISGSCIIGDNVMMGGQVGVADHLTIGDRALIAAGSGLMRNVPTDEKWGGSPAKPIKEWLREVSLLTKLTKKRNG